MYVHYNFFLVHGSSCCDHYGKLLYLYHIYKAICYIFSRVKKLHLFLLIMCNCKLILCAGIVFLRGLRYKQLATFIQAHRVNN